MFSARQNRLRNKRKRNKRKKNKIGRRIVILCAILCALLVFIRFYTGNDDNIMGYNQAGFVSESEKKQRGMKTETQYAEQTETESKNINIREQENVECYNAEDWKLTLVNPWNALPEDYEIFLITIYGDYQVDSRCYQELTEMLKACEEAGLSPRICSAYRTMEKQESLYQEKVEELLMQGLTLEAAREEAATSVAYPGTSEHQLGLAVDIVDNGYQLLVESQENTPVQQWLIENSWKYGFILRYPKDKSALTGIVYEPWHYRYVGKEAAKEIHNRDICLEEYLAESD